MGARQAKMDGALWQKGEPMSECMTFPDTVEEFMDSYKTEIYRLRLEHYIDDGEKRHRIEEPLVVSMVFDATFMPAAVCLNSMLDKMREEILSRGKES